MARRGYGFAVAGLAGTVAIAAVLIATAASARAAAPAPATPAAVADPGGPYPRFESLRSDKVNMRSGPGGQYPIEWVLTRKDMPVEILLSVDHWRRIRDWQGTLGWVQEKMVWSRREVMITGNIRALHQSPDPASPLVARAEPGVIGKLVECRDAWCEIEAGDYSGWVRRGDVFGVSQSETVP
jgi:SH3-like domain-containing protein